MSFRFDKRLEIWYNVKMVEAMRLVRVILIQWYFVGWSQISAGINLSLTPLNIQIHIPSGFIRIGEGVEAIYANGEYVDEYGFRGLRKRL